MQIHVKMMGTLRSKLPEGSVKGRATMEVEPGATLDGLLSQLNISSGEVHLILINDEMEVERDHALAEGDNVTVFPPVAGG